MILDYDMADMPEEDMMFYRAVEIKDGESIEPVSFVGVHPVIWYEITSGPPTVGFVEDDTITDLLAACEAAGQLAVEIHDWCANGEAAQVHVHLIQTNATMIASELSAAIARARGEAS